jgi:hypothetical protein
MTRPISLPFRCAASRRRLFLAAFVLGVLLFVLAGPSARAGDVYSNIAPASQIPAGGLMNRYPIGNYQLDQYFPGISVGLTSGIDVSGVIPLIAYGIAQIIWLLTAFLAYAVITIFAFAFSLDLVNGDGTPGSGALTPVADAIHNLYTNTLGAPWLVAAIVLAGCWAMWKALVQRRYTETAGALATSLLYCVLAIGIVTQPQRTIAPLSKLSNELSTSLLSLTNHGSIESEQEAKTVASNQLFSLLILDPWTVLEFGGTEHCATTSKGKTRSVAVRPLSSNPTQDTRLAGELERGAEIQAQGKICINDRYKYTSHFLAYPFQSHDRNSEHNALEHGDTEALPDSDPAKHNGTYSLGPEDKPAAETMGKGGQYQRFLLSIIIFGGEIGAYLLLGALGLGMIVAQLLLLAALMGAPFALLIGIFPGRGHDFFRAWLGKLGGFLAKKVIYSLILAIVLAVSQALVDATSNLGWLMAFALQAAFMWAVFLQRHRLTTDFLAATAGPRAGNNGASRLQSLYYTTGLARRDGLHQHQHAAPPPSPPRGRAKPKPGTPPPKPDTDKQTPAPSGSTPQASTASTPAPTQSSNDTQTSEEPA